MHGKAFRWGQYQNLMLSLAATSGSHLILPLSVGFIPTSYLHLLLEADEVSRDWWQLVSAICEEGDGWILCEWYLQGHSCTPFCCISFGSVELTSQLLQSVIVEFSLQSHRYVWLLNKHSCRQQVRQLWLSIYKQQWSQIKQHYCRINAYKCQSFHTNRATSRSEIQMPRMSCVFTFTSLSI